MVLPMVLLVWRHPVRSVSPPEKWTAKPDAGLGLGWVVLAGYVEDRVYRGSLRQGILR